MSKGFVPGDPRAIAAGRLGGARSGEARLRHTAKHLARVWGVMPAQAVAVLRQAWQRGYQAGWRARRRAEHRHAA